MGSGKTLYATWYALRFFVERRLYERAFANYHIISPDPERQVELLDKEAFKGLAHLSNALVIIDEAYLWLDSRRSSSKSNIDVSYLVLQSRKRGFDILYLAQVRSSVDLRLRDLSEMWVFAEKRRDGFHYTEAWRGTTPRLRDRKLSNKAAERLFPYFDTHEIVAPA